MALYITDPPAKMQEAYTHPYDRIKALVSKNRLDEAVSELELQVRQAAVYCNDLGVLCYEQGRPEQALRHYRNAVSLNPENTVFQKNLADFLCVEMGDYESGLDIYRQIFAQTPDDEVRDALGIICEKLGRNLDEVLKTAATPLNSNCEASSDTSLGQIAVSVDPAQEQILSQIRELEHGLRDDPGNAAAYNDLGVLYCELQDMEKCQFCYERAVELSPCNATFRKNLADFYFVVSDQKEEAMKIYTDLLSEDPTDIDTLLSIGTMCKMLGNMKDALFFHQQVIALEPWNTDAWKFIEDLIDYRLSETETPEKAVPVSIIIPLYNAVEYTKRCLASIEDTLPPESYELIIVDNNSTDGTAELLASLPATVKIIQNSENAGFAKACNQGARAASGKYLLFLNNDTEAKAGWLEALLERAEQDPAIGAVGSKLLFPDTTIQHAGVLVIEDRKLPDLLVARHVFYGQPADFPQANLPREYQVLTAACLLVRREAFEAVEGFDEDYWNGYEDVDLCFKLRDKKWRLAYEPASLLIHHESKSGGERFTKVDHNIRRLHEKWLGKIVPDIIIAEDGEARWVSELPLLESTATDSQSTPQLQNATGHEPGLTSIVILTCNQLRFTKECLASIQRHTPEPHEVIFVDNGSTDGTVPWLKLQAEKSGTIRIIQNSENLGFAKGCNQGIEAANGEFVLLLNNDVIVSPHWLGGMLECLRSDGGIGIVGPRTNNISGIQKVMEAPYENLSVLDSYAEEFRNRYRHRRIPYRRIVGFCMLFRRELVEAIGLLDESFGSGNFEDDDFCLRAELEGYRNVIAGDVFIHHVGSATFKGNNIDYTNAMAGNRKIFNDKWGREVRDENEALKILTFKTLEKADTLYQRGESDKAIDTILKEGISYASKENRFYFALAEYFIDQERFTDALDTLKELPDSAKGQRNNVLLGRALAGMGNLEEAEKLAKSALLSDPSSAPALSLSGRISYDSGRQQEAISLFETAITADPGYGEAYTCLGLIALQEERLDESLKLLEKGFLYSPLSTEAANHYHSLITASGKFDRAEDLFREMHRFYPQHRTLHFLLIDILIRQEKYQQAITEIEEACTIFGIEDGMLAAGLDLRKNIGPLSIEPKRKKAGTSVSLCMIVKNEEMNLPRCLQSLKPIVDEIIVVDTGSTDRTRVVAELFGAKVLERPWNGDFSAARNVSMEHASGNWVLVMDADEVISPYDHEQFRQLLKTAIGKNSAFDITTRNYLPTINTEQWQANDGQYPEEAGAGWTPSSKVRLFPNLKSLHFANPIHEMIDQSLAHAGISISKAVIPIHHYGYLNAERQREKGEQYYLLGKKKLEAAGGADGKALIELAIQAGSIGRYEEAIELWSKVLELAPELPLAHFNLGFVYLQRGRFTEARDASKKALTLNNNYFEAANNFAMAELCLGNRHDAVKVLKKTLATKPDYPNALVMLALTSLYANKRAEGLEMFRKLSDSGVACVEFINEAVKKLALAKRFDEAGTILDAVLANGYGNDETWEISKSLHPHP